MHIRTTAKRLHEAGILGEVRDDAKLDLVVVRNQQFCSVFGHERPPEPSAFFRTNGDVVQVRLITAEATCPRDGLIERSMDATIGLHLSQQAFAVGRAELLHLTVAKQWFDDRMLAAQLFK